MTHIRVTELYRAAEYAATFEEPFVSADPQHPRGGPLVFAQHQLRQPRTPTELASLEELADGPFGEADQPFGMIAETTE